MLNGNVSVSLRALGDTGGLTLHSLHAQGSDFTELRLLSRRFSWVMPQHTQFSQFQCGHQHSAPLILLIPYGRARA